MAGGEVENGGAHVVRRLAAHPCIVTGVVATAMAVGHAVWIWHHRSPGALNLDEAAYTADALRFRRDLFSPYPLLFDFHDGGSRAPLVPLLSAVLLWIGPQDPRTVLLIQPIFMLVTCVAVCATARRLAGPLTGIAAGITFAVLPTTVAAVRSYWFGLGVTAFLALAVLFLLKSDRGRNRWIWAFGIAVGCMPLSRVMSIGFLPGVAAAAFVYCWGDVRARWRVLVALCSSVLTFFTVFLGNYDPIFSYLFDSGYGATEQSLFPGSPLDRPRLRFLDLLRDAGLPLMVVTLAVAAVGLVQWWRTGTRRPIVGRPVAAVVIVIAGGYAALLSTHNNGDLGFELPMVALLCALVAAVCARAPRWVAPLPVLGAVVVGTVTLANGWWLIDPGTWASNAIVGELRVGVPEFFAGEDPRFAIGRRDEQDEAAAAWWAALRDVDARIDRIAGDGTRFAFDFQGGTPLLNVNVFAVLFELRGPVPYYSAPLDVAAAGCDSEPDGVRRLVVVAVDPSSDDIRAEGNAAYAEALDNCWEVVDRVPLPSSGDLVLLQPGRG